MIRTMPIKVLTFSTLYPNREQPGHGIFVETRLRHLVAAGHVTVKVVAPIPWFPSRNKRFGKYARLASAPRLEERHNIAIEHPRFVTFPRVGMQVAPFMLYAGARGTLRRLIAAGFDFDLIDAHYYYPDGVAAALLAAEFGRPFVVTARGTDINLIAEFPLPQRMIRWAAGRAAASITVSEALKKRLVGLGADGSKIHALRNGVDLAHFHPCERLAARRAFGVDRGEPVFLSVGNLVAEKGHHITIEAVARQAHGRLLIAGDGPERAALDALASRLGVSDRVRLLGRVAQSELPTLYSAADVLILASSREGWANVLLEAMACGTPVVATDVGGTPEVVAEPAAGRLVRAHDAAALGDALTRLLAAPPSREATRRYAEGFSWDATTNEQLAIFERIVGTSSQRFHAVEPSPGAG